MPNKEKKTKTFKFKEEWINQIKRDVEIELGKQMDEAIKDIAKFYLSRVEHFYQEYSPDVYKRHPSSSVLDSGLGLRTFTPIKRSFWKGDDLYIQGGIALNTYNMYPSYSYDKNTGIGYKGRNDWVLYTFTQGIHGLPDYYDSKGRLHEAIHKGTYPLYETQYYARNFVQKNIKQTLKISNIPMM